jgi:hypothetical protein
VVYGAALEKRSPVIPERGFESHPLRQNSYMIWALYASIINYAALQIH